MKPYYSPDNSAQKKKIKISLKSNQPQNFSPDIEKDVFKMAINRSYIKSMAGSEPLLEPEELISNVANYALTLLPKIDVRKQLQQYWCLVAVNEEVLNFNETKSLFCGATSITSDHIDPKNLKIYQLFIGLGSRQFRFTSLQNYKNRFTVNVDAVEVIYASEDQNKNRIRIIVDHRYEIDFFFINSTLPFEINEIYSPADVEKICSQIGQHTNRVMQQAIEQSKGKLYKLDSKSLPDEDFYYKRYATEQQFSKYCQTGDVILFRDNHTMAKVQRFFTNSECDHIGVVFRDEKYGLCIFESNSGTGVSLAMWNQLVRYKWFQSIEGIYWRRLDMPNKSSDFDLKVKQFVKVNLHKEYGISLGKLLTFKQIVYSNAEQEKNRTYFCSELVAALYKYLGLLQPNKPSSSYLPKDFTDNGSINMINNSALESERRLVFNEKVLLQNYRFVK